MKIGPLQLFEKNVINPDNPQGPLLVRHILFRIPAFGVYIHKLCRHDHDVFHDHPWPFLSFILKGSYYEHTPSGVTYYKRFSLLKRPAEWRHKFELAEKPTWTLVLVGRRCRKWGFWLDAQTWCWWRKYNYDLGICEDNVLWTKGKD